MPGDVTQNYTFSMDSDDGSVLLIDGAQIITDTGAGMRSPCGSPW